MVAGDEEQRGESARVVLLRIILAIYVGVLVLATLPRWNVPFLRPTGDAARSVLKKVGVVPGIGLMKGSDSMARLVSDCVHFEGTTEEGRLITLYRPDCPPQGFIWAHDLFEHMVQQRLRNTKPRDIRPRPNRGKRTPSVSEWQYVIFGDYFCHSPLVSEQHRVSVRLRRTQYLRMIDTGRMRINSTECMWQCESARLAWPECS